MNVVYLGCNGFPNGFAEVQKQKMISKALVLAGAKVTVLNTKGVFKKNANKTIKYKGQIEGINYLYTSLVSFKPENFLLRNLIKPVGKIIELFSIFLLKKRNEKNVAILSTQNIYALIYYYFTLRIAGYKVVLSYEEFVKDLNSEKNKKGLHLQFDDIAHRYCDAILPISKFLKDYQLKIDFRKPLYKIPALTDFNSINEIDAGVKTQNNILFCGASAYYENIGFIIEAFDVLKNEQVALTLIIHGKKWQNQKVFDRISKSPKKDKIKILSNLSPVELFTEYKQARLLLIPLKPYKRDIARFPHKISEYTASKTPIVTTWVGEIQQYFKDNHTAFIAQKYNTREFADRIEYALDNPLLSAIVAENAYQLGIKNFHFKSISTELYTFLAN